MAYTKTNWSNGDLITAAKLNKMEDGIQSAASSGGIFKINMIGDPGEDPTGIDKSYNEIYAALESGAIPVIFTQQQVQSSMRYYFEYLHGVEFYDPTFTNSCYVVGINDDNFIFYSTDPDEPMTTENPYGGGNDNV